MTDLVNDINLELADPEVCDEDGEELREPTAEEMALIESAEEGPLAITSGFERTRAALPQPDRARSAPDLPRVKSNAFKRFIS